MNPLDFALFSEVHTSDLQSSCMKRVQLRHEGKGISVCETAKYRGLLAGMAIEELHKHGDWSEDAIVGYVLAAEKRIDEELEQRGEPLSDAVIRERDSIRGNVTEMLGHYAERMPEFYGDMTILGLEVPIRWTMPNGAEFASHLDLLAKRPDGEIVVPDFKWTEHTPTYAYLDRNIQFQSYWLAVKHGSVQIDGFWVELDSYPRLVWVHLPNLLPYKQKRTEVDEQTGEVIEYRKGDGRPMKRIVYWDRFDVRNESVVLDELNTRVRMIEQGLFPTNPDPVGCQICECRSACPSAVKGDVR